MILLPNFATSFFCLGWITFCIPDVVLDCRFHKTQQADLRKLIGSLWKWSLIPYVNMNILSGYPKVLFHNNIPTRVFFPGNRIQKNPGGQQGIDMCIFQLYLQNNNIFGRHSIQKREKKRWQICLYYTHYITSYVFYLSSNCKLWASRGKNVFINLCVPSRQHNSCQKYI